MYIIEMFIYGRDALMPHLFTLLNKMFEVEYLPEAWSERFVIPLHKKVALMM